MKPVIEPPNDRLRKKLGGSARAQLTPALVKQADAALKVAAEQAAPYVLEELAAIDALSRQRPLNAPSTLYHKAHVLRGIAGVCGMPALGVAASSMCRLLDGVDDGTAIDANLVTSIAVTMIHASKTQNANDPMLKELIQACNDAVAQAKTSG